MIRNLKTAVAAEASRQNPRNSEGAVIELRDGTLLMIYQRYEESDRGSGDEAPNKLVSVRSRDGGLTWEDPKVEVTPEEGDVNVYSPNLLRMPDGSVLFIYMRYNALAPGQPTLVTAVCCSSRDECETFTGPTVMWERQPYAFSSSCVRLLSNGNVFLPFEHTRVGAWGSRDENEAVGCAVASPGDGAWRLYPGRILLPMRGAMEGHAEELRDGRLMMVMRTQLGAVFKCFSSDGGESWTRPQTTGLRAPESCPELIRVPGSGKLMLIWNNSEYDPAFRSHYGKRSPLSVAISEDEGETFRHAGDIETDPGWAFSNPGAYWMQNGKCLLNYWAVRYTPDWVMSGLIHLKTAVFEIG